LLKEELNYNTAVIKYIHEHEIDKKGKDSYRFTEEGASFSITKNVNNETTIFLKKEISIEEIADWLDKSPYKIDLIFTEGFRNSSSPSILCVKDITELDSELNINIKMISGLVIKNEKFKKTHSEIPILDVNKDFQKFLEIFEIK
jgi:molybdopterin-guanine dinucleotide biosynthesis protein MobB